MRRMRLIILPIVAALAVPATAHAQNLTILNWAHVPKAQVRQAEHDVARQANNDLNRYWGTGHVRFVSRGGWPIYLRASGHSMDPAGGPGSAVGFHTFTWHPYAVVWTGAMAMYGYSWQGILSHEAMETLVDPTTTRLLGGPGPDVGYIAEVCDPVPDWSYYGEMADFVTPAWFTDGTAPWDGMRMLHKPQTYSWTGGEGYWDGTQWLQLDHASHVHANEARHRHIGPPPVSIQGMAP